MMRAAVDDAAAVDRLDDRYAGAAALGVEQRADDELAADQRAHAVVYGYRRGLGRYGGQTAADGVEPLAAAGHGAVGRHVEAGGEVAPHAYMLLGQHDDYVGSGQRTRHSVDRACQHRHVAEHHELLGQVRLHAAAAAAGDDYCCDSFCHISFFPNPSVLSVNFM